VGAEIRAAKQFHAREGSLQTVPRKAVEQLTEPDGTVTEVRLGTFSDNARRWADKLTPERRAQLDALGMRWPGGRRRGRAVWNPPPGGGPNRDCR
jgi:hypothetical protein